MNDKPFTKKLRDMCSIRRALLSFMVKAHMGKADKDVQEYFQTFSGATEEQLSSLMDANQRLKNKNRNYRTGLKNLQRAHEALLHRFNTLKNSVDYRYQEEKRVAVELQTNAVPEPGYTDYFPNSGLVSQYSFETRAQGPGVVNTRL